jgi:hypothetical protein
MASNGSLLAIYQSKASSDVREGFLESSKQHMENIAEFVRNILPDYLPESDFIGGERPGEDDFHVVAWLSRLSAIAGGAADKDGIKALEKELNGPVPEKVVRYFAAWSERDSWKTIYAKGLH